MSELSAVEVSQLCTFYVDNILFGVDVTQVQEVIQMEQTEMTPVPLTPSSIVGLINLRGQIVTALDLRARLGLSREQGEKLPSTNVVIRHAGGVVSLLVDHISDVVNVDKADFEQPPATMSEGFRELVRGAYKLNDKLLVFLDSDLVANTQLVAAK